MKKVIVILSVFLSISLAFMPSLALFAVEQSSADIIEYGTIIEEEDSNINTLSNEYTIEEIPQEVSINSLGNNESMISNYVDPVKVENNAGTHYINYNNESTVVEYSSETNDLISKNATNSVNLETMSQSSEYFIVEDGIITEASEANVITLGGAEHINYIYPTIEDAHNQVNGTSIDGGAQTGSYSETIYYEGHKYVHVTFSGYEGYMYLNDVQIIPSYIEMNTSYYFSEDGIWYYASAIDPLVSNEFMIMPTSDAPVWAEEGVKYYSNDTETFTTDEYMSPETYVDYTNSAYFQNLSVRSTSAYTAAQYDAFLAHKGYTNSEYYGHTQAFVDAQELYGINSLLLFSMANLESAYGTSTYAKQCNNFFGRGAFDSNPDNACEGRQFPQPEDGILAQGIFLSVNFLDQADWRYEGSYVGTLDGGLNAHYASDGEWGQKIGSLAYECDKYLGSWDNNYFKIVEIVGNVPVYTTSSMTTQVRAQGVYMCNADKTQCIDSDNPNSYVNYYIGKQTNMPVRVVVTGETSNAYEIQVETGVNLGASGFITWTYAETGDHPNYEGANHGAEGTSDENYVSSGYINFANDYSNMSANQFWIPKTYNGSATTKTVANNPIKDTQRTTEFLPCSIKTSETVSGNIKTITSKAVDGSQFCTQKYDVATGKILKSTNDYYISGNQYSSMSIDYYSNGKYKIKNYIEYDIGTTNKIYESTTYYNSDGTYDYAYYYDYYSSGELKKRTYKDFTNNKNTYKSEYNYTAIGVLDWYTGYYYDSSGNLVRKENKDYDPNSGVLEFTSDYHYSGNEINYIYSYYYYENGEKKTQIYQDYANDNVIFRSDYNYRSNGVLDWYTAYYYDSNGKINRKENKDYNYSTGKLEYSSDYHYKDGVSDFTYSYYYYENGKKKTQIYQDYNQSGQLIYRSDYNFTSTGIYDWYVSYNYHSNGKISKKTIFDYNSDGQIYYEATYTYNSSGQQIDYYYNYR